MSSTEVLAIKYKPKRFSEVVGNKEVVTRFRGILKTKKIPKSLLLIGPSGTGKTTLANLFEKAVNCATYNLCGKCDSCKTPIESHPDVMELNAADTRGIDDIRALIQHARYKPRYNYRIIGIDEAQQLTSQAMSALLKPLEQANNDTVWVLGSMTPEKIPTAVLGRCTVFDLKFPAAEEIAARLKVIAEAEGEKKLAANDKLLLIIAQASGGHVRNAVSLLENTLQYIAGVKDKTNIEKLVITHVLKGTTETEDTVAIKVLYSIYKGSAAGVHASLAESENLFMLAGKLLQLNMYALDTLFIRGPNRNVWHTPVNKRFVSLVQKKLNFITEKRTNLLYLCQQGLNDVRLQMSSFLLPDRSLITAKLAQLAIDIGRAQKKSS